MVQSDVRPLYDENNYLRQSLGAAEVVSALASGRTPSQEARNAWYGVAPFPPLHPLILSAGRLFPTDPLSGARLVNVLTSSVTTILVFVFAIQLTRCRTTAFTAGMVYAVYPSFVAYSHYLWTEPTFNFIMLVGAVSIVAMFETSSRSSRFAFALLGGVCAGATALARAAGMPLLLVLPAYVFWGWHRRQGYRGAWVSAAYLVVMLAMVAPWQMVLPGESEPSDTRTHINQMSLYMGNNPWVIPELGAAFRAGREKKCGLRRASPT